MERGSESADEVALETDRLLLRCPRVSDAAASMFELTTMNNPVEVVDEAVILPELTAA